MQKFETLMMIPRSLPSPAAEPTNGRRPRPSHERGSGVVHKCIRCSWEAPRGEPATVPANRGFLNRRVIMHKPLVRTSLSSAAAALLLLSGVSAQACEIWRDEELGIWRGNCKLKDFLVSQTFIATYQPRVIFKWPDLHIRKFKYFVIGSSVEIYADVENIGMGNAAASTLSRRRELSAIRSPACSRAAPCSSPCKCRRCRREHQPARERWPRSTCRTRSQDWDLMLLGVTDPPTDGAAGARARSRNRTRPTTCRCTRAAGTARLPTRP